VELAGVLVAALVSVRKEAGEGETAGGWEISFAAGFVAAVFNESRLAEELGFAFRETSELAGCSVDSRDAARAVVLGAAGVEDSTRLPRNLGSATIAPTTKTANPIAMT